MTPHVPPHPLFVLIVEDDAGAARSLATLLELHGHEPFVVANEREAVRAVQTSVPDAILADLVLQGESGYDVVRRVCDAVRPRPLLIAMTGYAGLQERSLREGFDHHLEKPLNPDELLALLSKHAERLGREREPPARHQPGT